MCPVGFIMFDIFQYKNAPKSVSWRRERITQVVDGENKIEYIY